MAAAQTGAKKHERGIGMNSREVVRATLDLAGPERVARFFNDPDLFWIACSARTYATDWRRTPSGDWERLDEFGNIWGRLETFTKGEVVKGVLNDWAALDAYRFPDFSKPEDYDVVRKARAETPDKWIIGSLYGFAFSIARKMRKLEQYLLDLLVERERIRELHDRIDAYLETMIRNHAAAGADAVMIWEDWGTQTQLLISPALWLEEFFPRFRKLCAMAHECGLKVFMHSCGEIRAIIPHLIEAGIDLLQFDQPDLHGIDALAEYQKRHKITFWCPVDIQRTLQ